MVKNLNTIDRGTKIRLGRWHNDDQADNTIVINASDTPINASNANALYMKPIRSDPSNNTIMTGFDPNTYEILDTGLRRDDIAPREVDYYANIGNTFTSTIKFEGDTSLTTEGVVGIANVQPIHTLDVGTKFYVDENGANVLTVLGDTYVQDDVVIGGNLDVRGTLTSINTENTTIKDAIIELGKGNTSSDIGIIMDRPDTNVVMGYRDTVDEFVIAHTTSSATSSTITPSSELIDARVHGRLHVNSNLTIDTDTLHVDAIRDRVGINTLNPQTDLDVVGSAHVHSDFNVDTDTLFVDASTDRVGINTLTPSTDFHVEGSAYVSGNVTVDTDTFHVDTVNDRVGVNTSTPTTDFHVEGSAYVSGNVDVQTNLNVLTDAVITGNTDIQSELNVTGNTFISSNAVVTGNTDVQSELNVTGNAFVSSNLNAQSELNVTGNAFMSSNVVVTGNVDVQENLNVLTDAVITGNTDIQSELNVTGNAFVSSNLNAQSELNVTGNAFMSSNVVVSGNVDVQENLNVLTDAVITGNIDIQSELNVTGNAFISSNAVVTGNTDVQSELNVTGNAFVSSNLNAQSELNVTGNAFVSSNLNAESELNVTGNAFVSSNVVVTGNTDVQTDLNVTGNVYATGYYGDGGLLSNVTLQVVSDPGNTTSNTIQFTNPTTALATDLTSNVEVKLDQLSNVSITNLAADQILVYDDSGNWVNEFPLHNYIKIRNAENGITMLAGNTVYIDSFHNANVVNAKLAKADSPTTMPSIGIVYDASLAPGTEGVAVAYGKVNQMNTLAFNEGETLYVSNTYAGVLSNVKPYGTDPDLIQNIGVVTRKHESSGAIFVTGVGRANDIPNAPIVADETDINYVYVNNENNDLKKILPTNLLTQLQTFEQVSAAGNTVSNIMTFTNATTGIITTGNVEVGSNISVMGLVDATNKHVPMVGLDGFLEKSPIYFTPGGTYVVSAAEAEFLGNLTLSGNTTILNSESVTISDRIFGVAANNSASGLDSGFMIEHQEGNPLEYANVALIYHADEHRFSFSYTQNTFTDDHILHYEDETHQMLIDLRGNVQVQHNLVVNETVDVTGTTSLANDLTVGAASNLFVDVSTSRVGINEASPSTSLDVGGDVNVQSVGSATSKTTGALVVAGGVGVGGDVYASNTVLSGDLTVDTDTLIVNSTTDRVGINKAAPAVALDVVGDVHVTDNLNVDSGTLRVDSVTDRVSIGAAALDAKLQVGGNVHVESTTEAFSTATGAATIAGGLGVIGNVHATQYHGDGSKLTGLVTTLEDVANNGNTMSNVIIFENATTGLVTDGKVGVSTRAPNANLHVVGNVHVVDTTEAFSTVTGAVTITGGLGVVANVHATQFHGDGSKLTGLVTTLEDVANNGNTMSNVIIFTNGDTGLVTTGKIGVSTGDPDANLHVVGNVHVADTTEAFSKITGAMTITGGLGVVGNVHATQYHGDGSKLTGLVTTLEDVANNGNN